jgi:YVTN family beta-propeller protein
MSIHASLLFSSLLLLGATELGDPSPASPATANLVAVNQKEHTVLLINAQSGTTLATISVGVNGHEAIVSHDGRFAYVPIYGNSGVGKPGTDGATIDVIDIAQGKLAGSIELGKPVRPHRAEIGPGGMLYVSAELSNAIDVIDPAARRVVAEIPTGQVESHMFVISPDGKRAYTANVSTGTISVLDLEHRTLLTTVPVSKTIQRISISRDGRRVFTQDQTAPRIAVLGTVTNKISDWIDLPDAPYASAVTPDGHWLLAVSPGASRLHAVDLGTLKLAHSIDLPSSPMEILVGPAGTLAYVSCFKDGKIAVVDLKEWKLLPSINVTPGVDGLAWVGTGN